jgi:hypothetical protein
MSPEVEGSEKATRPGGRTFEGGVKVCKMNNTTTNLTNYTDQKRFSVPSVICVIREIRSGFIVKCVVRPTPAWPRDEIRLQF